MLESNDEREEALEEMLEDDTVSPSHVKHGAPFGRGKMGWHVFPCARHWAAPTSKHSVPKQRFCEEAEDAGALLEPGSAAQAALQLRWSTDIGRAASQIPKVYGNGPAQTVPAVMQQ